MKVEENRIFCFNLWSIVSNSPGQHDSNENLLEILFFIMSLVEVYFEGGFPCPNGHTVQYGGHLPNKYFLLTVRPVE